MNEKRKNLILIIFAVLGILLVAFGCGFFAGKGTNNTKIAEAEARVVTITKTVEELNDTIELTNDEIRILKSGKLEDKKTIEGLRQSDIELRRIVKKQGELITEITNRSIEASKSSRGITDGIEKLVSDVEGIIVFVQEGEN